MKYYDTVSNGFYDDTIHRVVPESATPLTPEEYQEMRDNINLGGIYRDVGGVITLIPLEDQTTAEEKAAIRLSLITNRVQGHLNSTAKGYGYDSIATAVTYADEPSVPKFQTEGQAFRAWRSLVWDKCYQILADYEAGTISEPTPEEVIAQLPSFTL